MTVVPVVSVLLICLLAAPVRSHDILVNVFGQLVCNAPLPFRADISLREYETAVSGDILRTVYLESDANIMPFNITDFVECDGFAGNPPEIYLKISHNCNSIHGKLSFDTDIVEIMDNAKPQNVNYRSIEITDRGEKF